VQRLDLEYEEGTFTRVFYKFGRLCTVINSSLNFAVYSVGGQEFKRTLVQVPKQQWLLRIILYMSPTYKYCTFIQWTKTKKEFLFKNGTFELRNCQILSAFRKVLLQIHFGSEAVRIRNYFPDSYPAQSFGSWIHNTVFI
jgi:hypothetical protein